MSVLVLLLYTCTHNTWTPSMITLPLLRMRVQGNYHLVF